MRDDQSALILVDLQNDFCSLGSLPVPNGEEVIPIANQLQSYFSVIVASQDFHPHDHMSFAVNHPSHGVGDILMVEGIPQILWPVHCVQGTFGADFHEHLDLRRVTKLIHKGIDPKIDSYSAFYDNEHRLATGLADYLNEMKIKTLYVMGLATEYCVKYTALDAKRLGFDVHVILDACRGVEMHPGDIHAAMIEMREAGVCLTTVHDFLSKQSDQ